MRCGCCLAIAVANGGLDRPLRAARPAALSSLVLTITQLPSLPGLLSCDSGRQRVRQIFTYSGFPGCRARGIRAVAPMTRLLSRMDQSARRALKALNTGRSLASHAYLTLFRDSSVSIESALVVLTSCKQVNLPTVA